MAVADGLPLALELHLGLGDFAPCPGREWAGSGGNLLGHVFQQHPLLRPPGTGQAGPHLGQVEFDHPRVLGVGRARLPEQALSAAVGFHPGAELVGAPGLPQVGDRLAVHREEPAGGAVLRRHVGHRGPVGQAQALGSGAEVLDEAAHHAHDRAAAR